MNCYVKVTHVNEYMAINYDIASLALNKQMDQPAATSSVSAWLPASLLSQGPIAKVEIYVEQKKVYAGMPLSVVTEQVEQNKALYHFKLIPLTYYKLLKQHPAADLTGVSLQTCKTSFLDPAGISLSTSLSLTQSLASYGMRGIMSEWDQIADISAFVHNARIYPTSSGALGVGFSADTVSLNAVNGLPQYGMLQWQRQTADIPREFSIYNAQSGAYVTLNTPADLAEQLNAQRVYYLHLSSQLPYEQLLMEVQRRLMNYVHKADQVTMRLFSTKQIDLGQKVTFTDSACGGLYNGVVTAVRYRLAPAESYQQLTVTKLDYAGAIA